MEVQIAYLVNAKTDNGIMVRQEIKTIDAKVLFGDDLPEVGQIQAFYIRLPWNPESIIEFHPRPYLWGAV